MDCALCTAMLVVAFTRGHEASHSIAAESMLDADVPGDVDCFAPAEVDEGDFALRLLQRASKEVVAVSQHGGMCGGVAFDERKETCCGNETQELSSQGCCAGRFVYNLTSEGCCDDTAVYNYRSERCRNGTVKLDYYHYYRNNSRASAASSKFSCMAAWPPKNATYLNYWRKYCSSTGHKAWAYTLSCKLGWVAMRKSTARAALSEAMRICRYKARSTGEACAVFDADGSLCHAGQEQAK
eukprot:TRINITY_DN28993_c0_g1_i2.p1 TRINITY_DN28993_c0_g1~~TRINITY_DN28993_c0_g1_i2.p1  ORF type:complete len:248 (+),score=45.63 TRINITY_DN28993_c0_g1_i2:27-746(+)